VSIVAKVNIQEGNENIHLHVKELPIDEGIISIYNVMENEMDKFLNSEKFVGTNSIKK